MHAAGARRPVDLALHHVEQLGCNGLLALGSPKPAACQTTRLSTDVHTTTSLTRHLLAAHGDDYLAAQQTNAESHCLSKLHRQRTCHVRRHVLNAVKKGSKRDRCEWGLTTASVAPRTAPPSPTAGLGARAPRGWTACSRRPPATRPGTAPTGRAGSAAQPQGPPPAAPAASRSAVRVRGEDRVRDRFVYRVHFWGPCHRLGAILILYGRQPVEASSCQQWSTQRKVWTFCTCVPATLAKLWSCSMCWPEHSGPRYTLRSQSPTVARPEFRQRNPQHAGDV